MVQSEPCPSQLGGQRVSHGFTLVPWTTFLRIVTLNCYDRRATIPRVSVLLSSFGCSPARAWISLGIGIRCRCSCCASKVGPSDVLLYRLPELGVVCPRS